MPRFSRSLRTPRTALAVLTVAAVAGGSMSSASAASTSPGAVNPASSADTVGGQAGDAFKDGTYIVQLAAPPAATYTGTTRGYAATRPATGKRLDVRSSAVRRYRGYLAAQQDKALSAVGARPLARYSLTVNGFGAKLTGAQAAKLARTPGVLNVAPSGTQRITTTETPAQLGLTGSKGLWSKLGGTKRAGKGVVIGVLDTGIWPENASFAGSPVTSSIARGVGSVYRDSLGRIVVPKGDGGVFAGACQTGPTFPATTCNSKVVSARYFSAGILGSLEAAGGKLADGEELSPRDGGEHGSHTASTAAGVPVSNVTIRGRSYGNAVGMAPAAKLAVYKVLWNTDVKGTVTEGTGSDIDIVAGIDQAVADGVDVINLSLGSGGGTGVFQPAELAMLNAAAAGVFIAASAGNDGPGPNTTDHNSPWLTTVAASTAHRFEGTVRLGNGRLLRGASVNGTAVPATSAVLAGAIAAAGVETAQAALCAPGSLDPAKAAGKVVVCDRGVVDRVAKSAEVKRAGGVAMVLVNVTPGSLDSDFHSVPTVHLDEKDGAVVKAYLATAGATVALLVGDRTGLPPTVVRQIAGFSSRGPALGVNGGDVLKPDITAPGVSIIASVPPRVNEGDQFAPLSGTSMSAPHIAGLAALVLQKYPLWSPARVKSAMMTTAGDLRDAAGKPATDPFAQGAGLVEPRRFLDPGLVYDAGSSDWLSFLEGLGADTGTGLRAIDPSDLNQPSIAVAGLAGKQTVTRRVTALRAGTYKASASVAGVTVKVSPSTLTLKAGQTRSFKVAFTRGTAKLNTFTKGFLTWKGAGRTVRSPIAVEPVIAAAPAEVSGTGASGSLSYGVRLGATSVPVSIRGLAPGTVTSGTVTTGPLSTPPAADTANVLTPLPVAAGTTLARVEVDGADGDDLDLYLYRVTKGDDGKDVYTLVGVSGSSTADERVDLLAPAAGQYVVHVAGFATPKGGAYSLRTFTVGSTSAGNATVSPTTLKGALGSTARVTVRWSGLTAGTPYLGWVGYGPSGQPTIVSIG